MRQSGRYCSFGGNSSVKPQNPEQHLTPLQQKDVLIELLIRKLKESESKLKEREAQIEGLKAQLGRTKDAWLEEECIRVETELAFWEARKEIKQLRRMNESLKNRLAERDKKIQEYGMVIRSVNERLERLLAQNARWLPSVREEQGPEYTCEWEGKPSAPGAMVPTSLVPEDRALEEEADSRLSDDTATETDSFEESLTTTTSELSDPAPSCSAVKPEVLENVPDGKLISSQEKEKIGTVMVKQASQTDVVADSLAVELPVQNVVRPQDACPLSPLALLKELGEFSVGSLSGSSVIVDLTPSGPNSAILLSPTASLCRKVEHRVNEKEFVKERVFTEPDEGEALEYLSTVDQTGHNKQGCKSRSLRDLLAVGVSLAGLLSKRASALHWRKGGKRCALERMARETRVRVFL